MFRQNEKLSCETSSDYRTSIHYSSSTGSLKRQLQKRNSKSNSLSMVMLRRLYTPSDIALDVQVLQKL
ncbi:hypothetical protein LINPERHAP2_LOCUS13896 [Linum perenne]